MDHNLDLEVKRETKDEEGKFEEAATAKVPSLLDLNPFDVKEEKGSSISQSIDGSEHETMETQSDDGSEIPFKLKKMHLYTAFRLHYSLNSLIIKPFRADFFANATVQLWLKRAREFSVRQAWNGVSAGMMLFTNYKTARDAVNELKVTLGSQTEVEVRHAAVKPEMPYRYPHEEIEFLIKERTDQALMPCIMVLENVPEDTREEDLMHFFPDARTVILLSHESEMKGVGLVEFPAAHKLRDAMNDFKVEGEQASRLEVKGEQVKLSKFMTRYNHACNWLRSHPPKAEVKHKLEDEERVALCTEIKSLQEERDQLLQSDTFIPDVVESFWHLAKKLFSLMHKLEYDTEQRQLECSGKMPEPKDLKINPVTIIGYPDEQDEEITAATGKIPSLLDVNFSDQSRKRSGGYLAAPQALKKSSLHASDWSSDTGAPIPLMDLNNTTSLLTQSMYNVTSGKGNMPNHVQSLANTIQKATEVLTIAGRNPQNVLNGPLETVKWCRMPLPLKKPLESRSTECEERLYIEAFPHKFDDRILENILCRFGGLIDAYFSKGHSSNYGYAKFADKESAQKAILVLNNQLISGIRVQIRRADPPMDGTRYGGKSYQRSDRSRDRDYY